jgi:hypothetical protein
MGALLAFAKQGAALSALPLHARTQPTRAACPCACCDESQPARPGILQPPGTRASLQQTSASATAPSRAMTLPSLSRNEQPHWTSPNLQPWQPWRRVPDLAPCTATPPRGGTHPEGMNNTGPAKRDRYCNASRSSFLPKERYSAGSARRESRPASTDEAEEIQVSPIRSAGLGLDRGGWLAMREGCRLRRQ